MEYFILMAAVFAGLAITVAAESRTNARDIKAWKDRDAAL